MLHVALYEPEIAPNTGNIGRSCAATGARLHLIGRLGFQLDDRSLRRAGASYWQHVDWSRHADWGAFAAAMADRRLWFYTARRGTEYTSIQYQDEDCLVFGGESDGLPDWLLKGHSDRLVSIPMPTGKVRSLNLAVAAGIALYEAQRQLLDW